MSDAYVQIVPDSSGKKIQAFENILGANTVEAQAVTSVDKYGTPRGVDGAPDIVQSRTVDKLLTEILIELRINNFYFRELNPTILRDGSEVLSQDLTITANLVE